MRCARRLLPPATAPSPLRPGCTAGGEACGAAGSESAACVCGPASSSTAPRGGLPCSPDEHASRLHGPVASTSGGGGAWGPTRSLSTSAAAWAFKGCVAAAAAAAPPSSTTAATARCRRACACCCSATPMLMLSHGARRARCCRFAQVTRQAVPKSIVFNRSTYRVGDAASTPACPSPNWDSLRRSGSGCSVAAPCPSARPCTRTNACTRAHAHAPQAWVRSRLDVQYARRLLQLQLQGPPPASAEDAAARARELLAQVWRPSEQRQSSPEPCRANGLGYRPIPHV